MPVLPESIRDRVVWSSISVPDELPRDLVFKIVESTDELECAFRMVYENYLPLGYCVENEHRMRATIHHALPTTSTLIALDHGRIVGTLTIVRDNRLDLPLERAFDVQGLRHGARRLAEITSLVIDKEYRRKNGGVILFPLLRLMYEYSTTRFGVNHLLIAIHPKTKWFYQTLLMFKDLPGVGTVDYMGAPARVMHLDLREALFNYERKYGRREANRNLYEFFVQKRFSNIQLPPRLYHKINDPVVDLDYFNRVFAKQLGVAQAPADRRRVESYITYNDGVRSSPRVEVEAPAYLVSGGRVEFCVKDASLNGFRAIFSEPFQPLAGDLQVHVTVAPNIVAVVHARMIWMSPSMGCGFQISKMDERWREFIQYLYNDQYAEAA